MTKITLAVAPQNRTVESGEKRPRWCAVAAQLPRENPIRIRWAGTALKGKNYMPYTPRHRAYKPNRVSKAAAASVVTTAAVAVPMIGLSSPASAADDNTWNQIAQCESGGNWSINTGNGYYGGLQFSKQTWQAYGGDQYGATADQASKSQQIEIAEKVQSSQGWGAWPECSAQADKSGGGGSPAPQDQGDQDQGDQDQGGQDQGGQEPEQQQSGSGDYTVESGDTLSKIADKKDVEGGWKALYNANKDTVDDPETIFPGDELDLP